MLIFLFPVYSYTVITIMMDSIIYDGSTQCFFPFHLLILFLLSELRRAQHFQHTSLEYFVVITIYDRLLSDFQLMNTYKCHMFILYSKLHHLKNDNFSFTFWGRKKRNLAEDIPSKSILVYVTFYLNKCRNCISSFVSCSNYMTVDSFYMHVPV